MAILPSYKDEFKHPVLFYGRVAFKNFGRSQPSEIMLSFKSSDLHQFVEVFKSSKDFAKMSLLNAENFGILLINYLTLKTVLID